MENVLYGGFEGSDAEICQNVQSLGEGLLNTLRAVGRKVVLVDASTGEEVNAQQMLSKVVCLAQYLQQQLRIKSGDTISVCSENRIEFAITIQAAICVGATVAPLNHSYIENEMSHAINLSHPKIIFTSPANVRKITTVAQNHPFVEQIILYDKFNSHSLNSINKPIYFSHIMELESNSHAAYFRCEPQDMKQTVAFILCSSGTTGLPKGVQLTQFNMFCGNLQFISRQQTLEVPKSGERVILGNLPMFHAFGMCVYVTTALSTTSKFVIMPRFVEEDFLRCIQTHKITTAYLVPPIMVLLAKSNLVKKYDLSSLQVIWCGAAPLSNKIETEVKLKTGVKTIRQGYGMTEGTFAFCGQDDVYHTNGSVGVLLKGVYARVVDVNTGKILGPNQKGELHFKGKSIMKGYVGDRQATSSTVDSEGWLHTGDVGYYDRNGEWYIVDRIKELIKYKGFQVPPAEIEALLLTHPRIKDCGVVGLPDELCGEVALAFVVKKPGMQLTEKDVIKYVAGKLSKPKHLHGGVRFLDEIPKSMTGKILRRVLREMVKPKSKL